MGRTLAVAAAVLVALLVCCSSEVRGKEDEDVLDSLHDFLVTLAGGDESGEKTAGDLGWTKSTDPCDGSGGNNGSDSKWRGIKCFENGASNAGLIKVIDLKSLGLSGTIDAEKLCAAPALRVVSLQDNTLRGGLPAGVSACSGLTHLYVDRNQLSGTLPSSLGSLRKLHVLGVSRNDFSGEIPAGLSDVRGLIRFNANDNHFQGTIPDFDLDKFEIFNVSNNNLTGPIPKRTGRFHDDSFAANAAGMCGEPVFSPCSSGSGESKSKKTRRILMYLGYVLLGAVIVAFVVYKLCSRKKNKLGKKAMVGKDTFDSSNPTTTTTSKSVSVYSLPASAERSPTRKGAASTSLVVLRRSGTASVTSTAAAAAAKDLRFEDLLKSPAELLGRGRYGSSYKVAVAGGAALAVKRVKDASVSDDEFRRRMERVARARHPAVLPPLAFYCAAQEKLVVYEFQSNGSLHKLLHGSIESSQAPIDWPARLHIATKVADGMAFLHAAMRGDGASSYASSTSSSIDSAAAAEGAIAHGALKSTNILFTAGMEPCISEYGVIAPPLAAVIGSSRSSGLRADVRAFGVLLLELLTGKATAAQGDGAELARWVTSVIQEEWTAEVFDRALVSRDGVSEQRMVRLLQVAMRCIDASPGEVPPTMREVAGMINAIREEDDRSLSAEA
ncbi:probable inactive receptor kinase At2g26730 [Hordeum vulgare subsp. vulgare]|uniref:Protein kinase domain-containing protein n=1 Tax=Hordeum vulgare subsp. vulgare TaxID=112509 RepID=A0A8I6YCZ0_HORVV|nr:probable inactive receptor kinase At2g26730 [Hordeum vulgare subsp. vulgare]